MYKVTRASAGRARSSKRCGKSVAVLVVLEVSTEDCELQNSLEGERTTLVWQFSGFFDNIRSRKDDMEVSF